MNRYYVLTLFPEMIRNGLGTSITGRAIEKGMIGLEAVNIRDYAGNKGENRINIIVEDEESPIVTIKNSNDIRAKVNEDITLSSFTAQDNATPSEEMVTHVFIINPNGSISAVDQETMKVSVSEEGEYKIVYYARDAYDNESYQMINLSVTK